MKTGEPYLSEYRLRAKDGSYRTFLARGVAVRNSQGVIQRWLGSMTDIHDQKLAQEALRQSEKLAVAARLASSISHEINNPLEGLTNLVYLLSLNSSLDSIARDYLLLAEDQLARVTHLTTRTLRFHRQSTSATPIDVSATVDALLTLHHHELQAKGIEIRRRYNPVVPLRCFDADIRHAIGNIIGNAVHAVDAHGLLCIRVRRDSGLSGKDHGVRITIADDGSGISPEVLPHIFDAFFSTKGDRGTGLGLWIARGIVERHGGRISVRTSTHAGRSGTTFSVFVPYETTPSR